MTDFGKELRHLIHTRVADVDDKVSGILVQVPFFASVAINAGQTVTLFELDALGCTIREVFISFYLTLDGAATFTPTWEKTRPADLVTFTTELVNPMTDAALGNIVTPAANAYYSYRLGEIAQGLQGRFRMAQVAGGAHTLDAWCVVLMEV